MKQPSNLINNETPNATSSGGGSPHLRARLVHVLCPRCGQESLNFDDVVALKEVIVLDGNNGGGKGILVDKVILHMEHNINPGCQTKAEEMC
jgi:hypothetical protein